MQHAIGLSSIADAPYRRWCAGAQALPVYALPWWIEAATGRRDCPVLWSAGVPDASELVWPLFMPAPRLLTVPPYCQASGPLSRTPGAVGAQPFDRSRYVEHIEAADRLCGMLPGRLRYIEAHLPADYLDWMPARTPAGMLSAQIAYTHRLALPADPAALVRTCYNRLMVRKIRSARRAGLAEHDCSAYDAASVSVLEDLCRQSLKRSGGGRPCGKSLHRLVCAAAERGQGTVRLLTDAAQTPVAAAFVAHHDGVAYYIAGGRSDRPEARDAMALLLDGLIRRSIDEGCHTFDFEGSMHRGIAFFFRSFGAEPHPYLRLRAGRLTLGMRPAQKGYYLRHLY